MKKLLKEHDLFVKSIPKLPIQYQFVPVLDYDVNNENAIIRDNRFSTPVLQHDSVPMLGFYKRISRIY